MNNRQMADRLRERLPAAEWQEIMNAGRANPNCVLHIALRGDVIDYALVDRDNNLLVGGSTSKAIEAFEVLRDGSQRKIRAEVVRA